jgi:Tfp pilus assembly protein PilV
MRGIPMLYGMFMPATKPESATEGGFILIEVLVSALILAIVAGAVLALITATTRSEASDRWHSQAFGLAQEDQARLRTMRITSLNNLAQTRTETVDGTTFSIESRGVFVNNSTGSTSCSAQNSSADYVQITSTVSSPALNNPISMQSVVSPSTGSLDPSHGTLAFQAKTASGASLSGVTISGTGTRNFNSLTDENGCAVFADLPAGSYKVTTSANGLINPQGATSSIKEIGVEANATSQVVLYYDKAGTISPSFVYTEPSTKKLTPAPVDSMILFDSENESGAVVFGTPGGTPTSTLTDKAVYPFKTKYAVYAGSCEQTNNPDPEEKGLNSAAIASVAVTGGSSSSPQIQVPALNLEVTYGSGKVKEALVILTDASCLNNGNKIKRTFTTNELGHISATAAGKTEAVGLPWGTYNVCVSAKIESEWRKIEATSLKVENLTTALSKPVSLSGTGSTGSTRESNKCS